MTGKSITKILSLPAKKEKNDDFLEAVMRFVAQELPSLSSDILQEVEKNLRAEFAGQGYYYIRKTPASEREKKVIEARTIFNGRNLHEVARRIGVSKSTVRRMLRTN